jgi:mannose-6-phosphate isomerase
MLTAVPPLLLLKILFAGQPLSIQVHPDDASARAMGLPHGKSEAWYVLRAEHHAEVAVGLVRSLTTSELRTSVADGTIVDDLARREVVAGDTIIVPGGTIHAIGAGIAVAEIQQRCDVTFRLFDYDRGRGLDVDRAIAVATAGPAQPWMRPEKLSPGGQVLAVTEHFVLQRVKLDANATWRTQAGRELWMLVINGAAAVDGIEAATGEALFAEDQIVDLSSGPTGAVLLAAYTPEFGGNFKPSLYASLGNRRDANVRGDHL